MYSYAIEVDPDNHQNGQWMFSIVRPGLCFYEDIAILGDNNRPGFK